MVCTLLSQHGGGIPKTPISPSSISNFQEQKVELAGSTGGSFSGSLKSTGTSGKRGSIARRASSSGHGTRTKVDALLDILRRGKRNLPEVLPFIPPSVREYVEGDEYKRMCVEEFMKLDKRGCHKLSVQELVPMIISLSGSTGRSLDPQQAYEFVNLFDADGNGTLELDEFHSACIFVAICDYLHTTPDGQALNQAASYKHFIDILKQDKARIDDFTPFMSDDLVDYLSSKEFFENCDAKFRALDTDGSRSLEPDELVPVIRELIPPTENIKLDHDQCMQFVEVFDKSGTGSIAFSEFIDFAQFLIVSCYFSSE